MEKYNLIENGKYNTFKRVKRLIYLNRNEELNTENTENMLFESEGLTAEDIEECKKIYNNEHLRKKRNFDNIIKWIFAIKYLPSCKSKKIIFGTLTFTDKVLSKTSEETRRRYVTRFLKVNCFNYIANIDFGTKNGREHYHFLALVDKDIESNLWPYGFDYYQSIRMNNNSVKASKNYLLKLNNHSFKDSNKQKSVIKDKNPFIENTIKLFCPEKYRQFKIMFLDNVIEPLIEE